MPGKIYRDVSTLLEIVADWRASGLRIVFTNGCFDVLHLGHLHTLSQASDNGDKLVVGLNSDRSITAIKGPDRPIKDEQTRAELLAAIQVVDAVIYFDAETPLSLIEAIVPDVLVKGGDYKPQDIVGNAVVTAAGGEVITVPFLEGHSTTALVEKIRKGT